MWDQIDIIVAGSGENGSQMAGEGEIVLHSYGSWNEQPNCPSIPIQSI